MFQPQYRRFVDCDQSLENIASSLPHLPLVLAWQALNEEVDNTEKDVENLQQATISFLKSINEVHQKRRVYTL